MSDDLLYAGEVRRGYIKKYDICWKQVPGLSPVSIELACFREKMGKRWEWDRGGATPMDHFKNVARAFWPEDAGTGVVGFIWNEWADQMLKAACENQYLGVAGCSGSGKSEFFALWAIENFLSDPQNTIILTTARTLVLSRLKVWGKVVKYWTPLQELGVPGKLLDSVGTIRYIDAKGDASQGDMAGIKLIPSEPKQEKESIGTIRGIHQRTVIFVADDMPDLSKSIMESVSNLASGCERFQFIGLGNPYSYFDAFGNFVKPAAENGYNSITVDDDEWKTLSGVCLHFDDTRNPRITMGDERLYWLNTKEKIDEDARINGANTARFWRERRGFWCPTGTVEQVYTEQEILNTGSNKPAVWLNNKKTRVSFLDPSFTTGGDRTILHFGTVGTNLEGLQVLQYDDLIEFHEDITDKEKTRTQQVVKWFRESSIERQVSPRYAGFDSTGAGSVLGDDIHTDWSKEVLAVNFGGKASDRAVSAFDPTPGEDRYANRVSEIWYSPKEAMRTGQIRGLSEEVIQELCLRKKTEEKGNNIHLRIRVQSKPEMKSQGIKSPDKGDSAMGLYELCRERLGLNSSVAVRKQSPQTSGGKSFKELFGKHDVFSGARDKNQNNFGRKFWDSMREYLP